MRKLLLLLLCLPALFQSFAQQIAVRGKIADKNGNALADVSVTARKSRTTVLSATDGSFEIKVLNGESLTVSRTGFKAVVVAASPTAALNVVLEEDMTKLEEVVVTGLATTVKKRNAANAVATVSAKDLTGTAPAQTLDASLNGKIAGANIVANSGAPGGGVTIKFRGVSTVYGNTQPLFVLDGIIINNKAVSGGMNIITQAQNNGDITSDQDNAPNRVADINPDEIENIEILKGASAAALYGSQAAAGVVLITTKKGKAGRTRVNVSQDLGVLSVRRLVGARPLSEEVVQNESHWDLDEYKAAVAAGKIYDYEKEIYGNKGFIRNSRVTFSGGNDKTSFLFSAGTRKENGIVKRTGYGNNSLRLNIDHRVTDKIKLGFSSSYTNTSTDRGITNNDNKGVTLGVALSSTPNFTELHATDGVYPTNIYGASNPIETRDVMTNNELNNRFIVGTTFEVGLQQSASSNTRITGRAGLDYYSLKSNLQFPAFMQFEAGTTNGHNVQGNAGSLFTNWAVFLVNSFKPSDRLSFTTTGGLTHEYGKFDQIINNATQLIGTQTSIDQAAALTALQIRNSFRNDGFFAQEEFAFNDYLNLTGAVRFDRSTNNGDHKKWNAYPKAGLAWNLSKMPSWHSGTISDLKLRVAYGESGNFPTFNSRFISLYSTAIGGRPGSLISRTLGNPNINAERQTELEAGIDVSFFKGRVAIEASYYNKLIKDLLLLSSPPGSGGFSAKWVNGGSLRNRGFELGVKTIPVSSKNIVWNLNMNFWKNRSRVVSLNVPSFDPGGNFGKDFGQFLIEEGQSATQIVSNNEKADALTKVGDTEPDFQMSWFNEVTLFNNLSLRCLMHWKKGGDNVNLTQALYDFGYNTVDYDVVEANGETASTNRLAALGAGASPYVQDATYLRIREIGLFYKLPVQSKVVQGIRVGASLNNFFTWTKYKGYDPEVSNFGTAFSSGIDVAPYPASKRVQFHLSFDF